MDILSFPIGLVVGLVPVVVSLAPAEAPARLFLDGRSACTFASAATPCTVDVGRDPHVHRFELRSLSHPELPPAVRWINRPGQQAEARFAVTCGERSCTVEAGWSHPARLEPARVTIGVDGAVIADGTAATAVFPASAGPHLVTVDAVFPDGAHAAAARMVGGGFVEQTGTAVSGMPLEFTRRSARNAVSTGSTLGGLSVRAVEAGPGSTIVVVTPECVPRAWLSEGSRAGIPGRHVTLMLAVEGLPTVELPYWRQSVAETLSVARGLAARFGDRPRRLADAVAVAALRAAAGGGPRAVVVWYDADREDASHVTAEAALAYASEVMVPVMVWAANRPAPPWSGHFVRFGRYLAGATEALAELLARQRVAWLDGEVDLARFDPELPPGVRIAGREPGFTPPALPGEAVTAEGEAAPAAEAPAAATPVAGGGSVAERVAVTAVTVRIRATGTDGGAVATLAPEDLEVEEDGAKVLVLGVEPVGRAAQPTPTPASVPSTVAAPHAESTTAAAPWDVTIYVASDLCSRWSQRAVVSRLEDQVGPLTGLGPVSVVVANPVPRVAGRAGNADELGAVLSGRGVRRLGAATLAGLRADATRDIVAARGNGKLTRIREAVRHEHAVVAAALGGLLAWARVQPANRSPRVLVLVADGFDLDPAEYYLSLFTPDDASPPLSEVRAELEAYRLDPLVAQTAAALAAEGWALVAVDPGPASAPFSTAAENSGNARVEAFLSGDPRLGAEPDRGADVLLVAHPRDALAALAGPTGGAVAALDRLGATLDAFAGSFALTYQADRLPDGRAHRLAVRARRPGVTIVAPTAVFAGTPELEAAVRAERVLAGGPVGDVPVRVVVAGVATAAAGRLRGTLETTADLGALRPVLAPAGRAALRVTVAVALPGAAPFVAHERFEVEAPGAGGAFVADTPVEWPRDATRAAVLVEELATGAWGAAVVELPRSP